MEIVSFFRWIESFDRVSEHGSWHRFAIDIQKFTEPFFAHSLSDFSKHPATGFMDQVMRMCEKSWHHIERQLLISVLDLIETREDNDTIRPEVMARNTGFDEGYSFFVREMVLDIGADNMLSRRIDEIPVIDMFTMLHIEGRNFRNGNLLFLCPLDEYEDSGESFFMIGASEEDFHGLKTRF